MKNSTKLLGGVFALTAIAAIAIASPTLAYRGDPSEQGPDYSAERHEAMESAFQSSDYESWKKLMSDKGRVTQVINADNFARFSEAHKLAEKGNIEESKKIRAELGLGLRNGNGEGRWNKENRQRRGNENQNRAESKNGNHYRSLNNK